MFAFWCTGDGGDLWGSAEFEKLRTSTLHQRKACKCHGCFFEETKRGGKNTLSIYRAVFPSAQSTQFVLHFTKSVSTVRRVNRFSFVLAASTQNMLKGTHAYQTFSVSQLPCALIFRARRKEKKTTLSLLFLPNLGSVEAASRISRPLFHFYAAVRRVWAKMISLFPFFSLQAPRHPLSNTDTCCKNRQKLVLSFWMRNWTACVGVRVNMFTLRASCFCFHTRA